MISTADWPKSRFRWVRSAVGRLFWAAVLAAAVPARAQVAPTDPKPPGDAQFAKQAEKAFEEARARFNKESNSAPACLAFARTSYDWADYAATNSKRAQIAEEGIAASRKALQMEANSVAGHYYLAMNLGQLARTKSWGALKIVDQMEAEFKVALGLDPKFDYAGADRGLGLLYFDSPGWPLSIGNKSKAHEHLEKALKLASDYPENHLNLVEANLKWGDKKAAVAGLKALTEIWPAVRGKLTGEAWAASWADWGSRRVAAEKKAGVKTEDVGAGK